MGGAQAPSWVTFPSQEVDVGKSQGGRAPGPSPTLAPGCPSEWPGQIPGWGQPGMVWGMGRDAGWGPSWDEPAHGFRIEELKGS